MYFDVEAVSQEEFDQWVREVKQGANNVDGLVSSLLCACTLGIDYKERYRVIPVFCGFHNHEQEKDVKQSKHLVASQL